jgi:hypothetical protein
MIFLLCRNHLISIKTLSGAPPPPLGHPPFAIVPYYLYTIMEKFPVQVIQRHRKGGYPHYEKRISTEQIF